MKYQGVQKEKSSAALSSVVAAVGLTSFKFIVGLVTNSLGILAEAAHSALDLVAAVMTFFAVRVADKPADREHPFGHGKVENVSALFETLLLLATSGWIIYEAIQRLRSPELEVEVSIWSFLVMGTSIVVDVTRSRMLFAAAKKHNSQALEADALHFSTDIWSSSVVILGLIFVLLGRLFPGLGFLEKGDAIAALVVAVIVVFVSGELGMRSIHALMDAAPGNGEHDRILKEVRRIKGISNVHAVRIRSVGAGWFVDMHVTMDGELTLNESHALTEKIERKVKAILPKSDVTIHAEPIEPEQDSKRGNRN
ncbi:MAG: cation transporter [Chloroflexi bacterium]|nr:cation transporter [Chloroflexota bacterium]